jgi:PAS domain S-box-containing protein
LETVFGYAREDTRPEPEFWERCLHPEDRVRVQADLTTVLNGSGTHWKNEYRFRRADDSYAAVVDRGYILRDAEGRPIRMLGSLVDLTERQELELRLNRSRRLEAIR